MRSRSGFLVTRRTEKARLSFRTIVSFRITPCRRSFVPDFRSGVLTQKGFGSAQGVIEHDLKFEIKNLPPFHQHSLNNGASTLSYAADAVELSPSGSYTQSTIRFAKCSGDSNPSRCKKPR